MDEPLASLDGGKQEILPTEQLKRTVDRPILYVSHSPTEVARLADHLVVLERTGVKTRPLNRCCLISTCRSDWADAARSSRAR